MVVGREHRSDARCHTTGHLPTETMATNDTQGSDKNPTTDDASDDDQSQPCQYQPRQYVDERLLESGRYDY